MKKKRVVIYMTDSEHKRFKTAAVKRGLSTSVFVTQIVLKSLQRVTEPNASEDKKP